VSYEANIDGPRVLALALQQSRLAAGISQHELARRLGVSRGFIGDIEAGRNSTMVKLVRFLGETGAVMKIDVPEGEPSVREPAKPFTPRQLEKRLVEAQLARERNEILRAQGLFGHNDYNPGPHRPTE
jgi:transcriptional regulator with XRE-family HTH domain